MTGTVNVFLASLESERQALQVIIDKKLRKEPWEKTFSDGREKVKVVRELAESVVMRHRIRWMPSDVYGPKKRAFGDRLFEIIGYEMLLNSNSTLTSENKTERRNVPLNHELLRRGRGRENRETGR